MWIAYGVVSAVVALFAATTYFVLRVLIEYDIRAAYFIFAICTWTSTGAAVTHSVRETWWWKSGDAVAARLAAR